jgi:hypothetical protein
MEYMSPIPLLPIIKVANDERLSNGKKCGLLSWRVIKTKQCKLLFYHPMGLTFHPSACTFIDLCEQTNVAFTISIIQTKRLHPGWEAFKRDGVTDKTKQWMYISP